MALSLAMDDVMDSLCKDDGARDAHRECCGGIPCCWSRESIALTREDCTLKILPGNGGPQERRSSAAQRLLIGAAHAQIAAANNSLRGWPY